MIENAYAREIELRFVLPGAPEDETVVAAWLRERVVAQAVADLAATGLPLEDPLLCALKAERDRLHAQVRQARESGLADRLAARIAADWSDGPDDGPLGALAGHGSAVVADVLRQVDDLIGPLDPAPGPASSRLQQLSWLRGHVRALTHLLP